MISKKAGFTDLFLFMIIAVIVIIASGVFIYIGGQAEDKLHETMNGMTFGDANTTQVIDNTMGKVNQSYNALYWISIFLIVGMVISILIGSYLVTTKPVFFIPYIFIVIIAIIVSVGINQAYMQVIADPTLESTFAGFTGANFIMAYLPMWIAVIGILGGIIMFVRMGSRENDLYGGGGMIYR